MMIIDNIKNIFQKQDNTIYCYTHNPSVIKHGEIEVAKKCLPNWYKELPADFDYRSHRFNNPASTSIFSSFSSKVGTVKRCPAIQGLFTTGIILKAWCDIKIFVSPEGYVDSIQRDDALMNTKGAGSIHLYSQRGGFLPNMAHWKIHSPWVFNTKKYRRFFWNGAYWWNPSLVENNIHIVPGFIDFFSQHGTEINMMLPIKEKPYEFNINFGDPLVHIFPIDNNPIKIESKLISSEEYSHMNNPHVKFVGSANVIKYSKSKN